MNFISTVLYLILTGSLLIFPSSAQEDGPSSSASPRPCLHALPYEIEYQILLHCDLESLNTLSKVDKTLCHQLQDDRFWRHKIEEQFHLKGEQLATVKDGEFFSYTNLLPGMNQLRQQLEKLHIPVGIKNSLDEQNIYKELFVRLELLNRLGQKFSWNDLQKGEFTHHYADLETIFKKNCPRLLAEDISKYKFIAEPGASERTIQPSEFGLDLNTMIELVKQIESENLDPFYLTDEGILCYIYERKISLPAHILGRPITPEVVANLKLHYTVVQALSHFLMKYYEIKDHYFHQTQETAKQRIAAREEQRQRQYRKQNKLKRLLGKIVAKLKKRTSHHS